MERFCSAELFAYNLSIRGRSGILDIVLVEHMMVPRQRKLLEDADTRRLYMGLSHRTT